MSGASDKCSSSTPVDSEVVECCCCDKQAGLQHGNGRLDCEKCRDLRRLSKSTPLVDETKPNEKCRDLRRSSKSTLLVDETKPNVNPWEMRVIEDLKGEFRSSIQNLAEEVDEFKKGYIGEFKDLKRTVKVLTKQIEEKDELIEDLTHQLKYVHQCHRKHRSMKFERRNIGDDTDDEESVKETDKLNIQLCKRDIEAARRIAPRTYRRGRKRADITFHLVMATDDSMSDDVFESAEDAAVAAAVAAGGGGGGGGGDSRLKSGAEGLRVDLAQQLKTPSPTGYRDYKPPADLIRHYEQQQEDAELTVHKTILLGDSGVGKTSLLVQFDTGKFQSGNFSATVGIGFTLVKQFAAVEMSAEFYDFRNMSAVDRQYVRHIAVGRKPVPPQTWNGTTRRASSISATQQPRPHPEPRPEPADLTCKVMLLGDSGVGKTCLLVRFRDGHFLAGNFISTVGIDFRNKMVTVDQTRVKLQIWDTAGQERFRSVTHAYYRDAHALLLLYDVTSKTSFDNIRAWLGEIREYAQDDVVIMLLGNKSDSGSERLVRREDGERLASEYNVTFMETSAKTGLNVELAFMAVARELKSKQLGHKDETIFNVQEYVREQTQTATCPPCNT